MVAILNYKTAHTYTLMMPETDYLTPKTYNLTQKLLFYVIYNVTPQSGYFQNGSHLELQDCACVHVK